MIYRINIITLISITAMILASCASSPTGRKQLMLISPQSAIVQSEKAYISTVDELNSEDKLVKDEAIIDRVATITGRVITAAIQNYPESRNWKWSVAIIDDTDTVNAWCMAGGRMAVYTGLFDQLKLTDDEFAHIMGHEVSHALANHTAERMSMAMARNAGLLALAVASDKPGLTLTGAALAAKLAIELPNSRTAESEADKIGMKLATLAGYEADAAVTLWDKMNDLSEKRPPEFLSTHPSPGNRQQNLAAMTTSMQALNPDRKKLPVHEVEIAQ